MSDDRDDRFLSGPGLIITKNDGRVIKLPMPPRKYTRAPAEQPTAK